MKTGNIECPFCQSKIFLLIDQEKRKIKGWFCPECKEFGIYKRTGKKKAVMNE